MPNVVATDAHDLESLIFRSSSLRSVLAEFGNAEKINRFEDNEGQDVRTALLERALVFGRLRWAIRSRATAASSTRCGRQPQRHVRVCQSKQGRCGGHRRWRSGILCRPCTGAPIPRSTVRARPARGRAAERHGIQGAVCGSLNQS